jgi:hypothetical protein
MTRFSLTLIEFVAGPIRSVPGAFGQGFSAGSRTHASFAASVSRAGLVMKHT